MSMRALDQVSNFSLHKGAELLLLPAIADIADDDPAAHTSVTRLAQKTRIAEKRVLRLLRKLRESTELVILKWNENTVEDSTFAITVGVPPEEFD